MASLPATGHKDEVTHESDEPGTPAGDGVVLFPSVSAEPLPASEDIVWFDPDTLAQRSEIGKHARRPGWWCPEDLALEAGHTPCWGAVQPSLCASRGQTTPLWNDPKLALVQHWSRAQGLAIACAERGFAYALLDQMLESLVVGNLFEREPEPHRALLVTERCAHAWWRDLLARWAHTSTPEGHAINAQHPDFANHWLLVSYDVWDQDQEALQTWLMQSDAQKALGFHLPGPQAPWAHLASQGRQWALDTGVKYLVAGQEADLDELPWDPRDRIVLEVEPQGQSPGFDLRWGKDASPKARLHLDADTGIYYF